MTQVPGDALIRAGLELTEGWPPGVAARKLGVARQTYWRWKNGDWSWLGNKGRKALEKVLTEAGVDVESLVSRETTTSETYSGGTEVSREVAEFLARANVLHEIVPYALDAKKLITLAYTHLSMQLPLSDMQKLEAFRQRVFGARKTQTLPIHTAESARVSKELEAVTDAVLLDEKRPVFKESSAQGRVPKKAAPKKTTQKRRQA